MPNTRKHPYFRKLIATAEGMGMDTWSYQEALEKETSDPERIRVLFTWLRNWIKITIVERANLPPLTRWQERILRFVNVRCQSDDGRDINPLHYWSYYLDDEVTRKGYCQYYNDWTGYKPMSLSQFVAHELSLGMLLRKPKPSVY